MYSGILYKNIMPYIYFLCILTMVFKIAQFIIDFNYFIMHIVQKEVLIVAQTEAEKKAVRKYLAKCKDIRIKYNPTDMSEYVRLQSYISDNNISATAYIKQLIKNDLDTKGY